MDKMNQSVNALRAILPTIVQKFSDVPVRFLADHWSPVRVIDETHESDPPRIWLRALNMDVVYDDGYVIRTHPRKYGIGTSSFERVTSAQELLQRLEQYVSPLKI